MALLSQKVANTLTTATKSRGWVRRLRLLDSDLKERISTAGRVGGVHLGGMLEAETLLTSTCWGLVSRSSTVRLGWGWGHCSVAGLGGCGRCLLRGLLPRYTLSPEGTGGAWEGPWEGPWCPRTPGHLGQVGALTHPP